jgi:drug/metabolite transporter (DMT)-like permease
MLLKTTRAVAAPTALARCPVRSAVGLFRSKWWTAGWLVALGAWLLHVGALSLAPLSTVQAVISGGLVFLAILAERCFGFDLGRRQWIGLLVAAIGLTVPGLTSGPATHDHASTAALIAVASAVVALSGGVSYSATGPTAVELERVSVGAAEALTDLEFRVVKQPQE